VTRHLRRDALVTLAEGGAVAPGDAAHARTCARCRDEVALLAAVLADLRADQVPEPSPLFWPNLSARISAAVARETPGAAPGSAAGRVGWRWWVSAASLGAAVVALLVTLGQPPASRLDPLDAAARTVDVVADVDATPGEAWDVLATVASSLDVTTAGEEVPELAPAGGEGAVLDLTPEERAALVQLLHQEIADGKPGPV
jgi:hypothetical protein